MPSLLPNTRRQEFLISAEIPGVVCAPKAAPLAPGVWGCLPDPAGSARRAPSPPREAPAVPQDRENCFSRVFIGKPAAGSPSSPLSSTPWPCAAVFPASSCVTAHTNGANPGMGAESIAKGCPCGAERWLRPGWGRWLRWPRRSCCPSWP